MSDAHGARWPLITDLSVRLIVFLAIVGVSACETTPTRVDGAEIVEFGLYAAHKTETTKVETESQPGHSFYRNFRLVEVTTTVPLKVPVSGRTTFGYKYRLNGTPGRKVSITYRLTHPPRKNGSTVSLLEERRSLDSDHLLTWNIGAAEERVFEKLGGRYLLQVLYKGRVLCEKKFEVVEVR